MRRQIPEPHALAPEVIRKNAGSETILESSNMSQMVGVLHQIGWLAAYSNELFTDLTIEAESSFTRINQLKGRLGRVTERLSRVDEALAAQSEEELANICAQNPATECKLTHVQQSGLFTPNSRPSALQATFEEARAPPPLHLLDQFVTRDPAENKYHKYGLESTCLDLYSDPNFFLKQCACLPAPSPPLTGFARVRHLGRFARRVGVRWLDEEEVKRKALKAERKAKKAARGDGAADGGEKKKVKEAKKVRPPTASPAPPPAPPCSPMTHLVSFPRRLASVRGVN